MDLKSIDLDAVASSIKHTAAALREGLEDEVKRKLEQISMAVDAARLLDKLPTGELIQRAVIAEVLPVAFPGTERPELGALQGSCELRLAVSLKNGQRVEGGWTRLDIPSGIRGSAPVVVKTNTRYRLLLFLLEQKS